MCSPFSPVASAVISGVGNAMTGLGSRYFRLLPRGLVERVVPKPGSGPSAATRERGYYRIETYTTTTDGARYVARMAQDGDPGYKATSVLLGECGLALATDRDKLSDLRGVLTPASAMGDVLLARLPAAGVVRQPQASGCLGARRQIECRAIVGQIGRERLVHAGVDDGDGRRAGRGGRQAVCRT